MENEEIDDILQSAGLVEDGFELGKPKDKAGLIRVPRKKLGRPMIFKSPEELYGWYQKYLADIEQNPIEVKEYVGKDAITVYKTHYRPPSWQGFEAFLFRSGVCTDLDRYRRNVDDSYGDFIGVVRAIAKDMFDTKYSGGALNLWNHNIIAKEMHLAEPIEVIPGMRPILEGGKELPKD